MNVKLRRGSGVYVFRARKPCALFNLPLLSRHFAYVGETNSYYHRIPQHIMGGGTYGSIPKPWNDRDPRVYYIPLPPWKWLLKTVETLVILMTWPVYNHSKNLWNPRRIPLHVANRQRYARDHGGFYPNFRPIHALAGVVLFFTFVLIVGGSL